MKRQQIHNRPELKQLRKKLRNNSTSAEATLWIQLKQKQLAGRKFRRQHSIGNFIVDFYCPQEKLAIELDGEDHFWQDGLQKDSQKTNYLKSKGILVIRFENKWVFRDIGFILSEIKRSFITNY